MILAQPLCVHLEKEEAVPHLHHMLVSSRIEPEQLFVGTPFQIKYVRMPIVQLAVILVGWVDLSHMPLNPELFLVLQFRLGVVGKIGKSE
jgi:hypothetical protein